MDYWKEKSDYSSNHPRQVGHHQPAVSPHGRDAPSVVKSRPFDDDGGDVSPHGRSTRNAGKSRPFDDDGGDVSPHGRNDPSVVKSRPFDDAGGDVSPHERGARSVVKSRPFDADGGDISPHDRGARNAGKSRPFDDGGGDVSPMEVDAIDDDEEEKAPVSIRGRKQNEETNPSHSCKSTTTSRKSNAKRDDRPEFVTKSLEHMKLENKATRTEYLNAGKGDVRVSSSGVNGNTSSSASDDDYGNDVRKRTDGKNCAPRKTITQSNSKLGKNTGNNNFEMCSSNGVDDYAERKARRDKTNQFETRKEAKGSNRSVNQPGGVKLESFVNASDIIKHDPREAINLRTGQGRSPVGSRRRTTGDRIPEDKLGKSGKKSNDFGSSVTSRSAGRSSRRSSSDSGSGNRSRSSSKASETTRNNGRSQRKNGDSRSNIGSEGNRGSSSSEHIRSISRRRARPRSSNRSSSGGSLSKGTRGRNRSTSESCSSHSRSLSRTSGGEEGRKRAQVLAVSSKDTGSGQQASEGHGTGKDRRKGKQKNSKAPKFSKIETGRNSESRERDISSSSKNQDKNKKAEKASGSKTKSSKQNKKARSRNKSKNRTRQDRSDNDEEGRNESVDRSARLSSEIVPARPRIQYKWQYEDDHGWTTYGQIPSPRNSSGAKTVTSDDIELLYLEDEERYPLVIEINNVQYLLDFQKMIQINQKTRNRRSIRRIIKNAMDDHSARGQSNLSRNSSENSFPRDGTNFTSHPPGSKSYSASNNLLTDRSNNYDKNRSSNTSANDFSVKHVWQFEDEHGKWITYGKSNSVFDIKKATTSDDIEKVYFKDPSKAIMRIQSKSNQYILDFRKMTQTNEQTQVQRKVRRVPEHATNTSLAEKVKPFAGSLVGSGKEYVYFEWQFEDEVGVWITYGQANSAGMSHCTTTVTSEDIEKYYNSLPKKVLMTIKSSTNDYVLDFVTMTQTNEKTSVQRRIRRIPKISRDNKPHNDFSSSSSSGVYPKLTEFNSAVGNTNSAPSYAMATAHGQGGGYSSHGSGAGNMHAIQSGAGGGYSSHGSGAGNMHAIQSGAGGGYSSHGSGAGNMHAIQSGAGGGFNGNGYDAGSIRPGHSPNQSLFMWQFMDEKGFWITYGQASSSGLTGKTRASSDDIEHHFLTSHGRLPMKIKTPSYDYELDFVNYVQLNTTTGARKHIRRVPLQHYA